jgi:RHS repeat-associated protein
MHLFCAIGQTDREYRHNVLTKTPSVRFAIAFLVLLISTAGISRTHAQSASMAPDARPYGTFDGSDIDSISTVNGGLQLNIPLWSVRQRGNLSLSFALRYNSPNYYVTQNCAVPIQPCWNYYQSTASGVYVSANTDVSITSMSNIVNAGGSQVVDGYYWQITTPDSGTHNMVSLGNHIFRAGDGTGWLFNEQSYTLTSRDGVRYVFQGSPGTVTPYPIIGILLYVEDPSGNRITLNYTPYTSSGVTYYTFTGWTDTLGRQIPASAYGGSGRPPGSSGAQTTPTNDFSGCTGPNSTVSATIWTPPGATTAIKFCYANVNAQTDFFGNATSAHPPDQSEYEWAAQLMVLQNVVLLDGTSFAFQYTPLAGGTYNYGELAQVTLPTGGTLGYVWSEDFTGCSTEANAPPSGSYNRKSRLTSRIVNANDGTGTHTWTYNLANGSSWSMVVQDPVGNTTRHAISLISGNCGMYETEADYYDSGSNLLRKDTTSYLALPNVNYFTQPGIIAGAALPTTHSTQWANGATRTTTTTYDSGFTGSGFQGSATFTYGNVILQTESDYGANGNAGATLKTTQTSYWAFQNSSALNLNFLDRPSSVLVTDGLTGLSETTNFGYDESSLVSGNASSPGWDSSPPNGSMRGNVTSTSRYWDTTSNYLKTTKTYTDTGLVASVTEPPNSSITPAATTSYQYSSTYDGAYVTSVTDALGHSASSTYDFTTGHVVTVTDANRVTSTYSYDSLLRLNGITRPGNGHTLASSIGYSYPDAKTKVQTTQLNSSIPAVTVTTRYDGLGHAYQVQHSDPAGDVYSTTTYDALGRKATQSTPYRSTSDATYGLTTFAYDGLGRTVLVTNPDGTSSTTAYTGATTQSINESNGSVQSQRLTRLDGLGRLIAVCEVSSSTPTVGSDAPSSCGLEIGATGYLTNYTQTLRGMTAVRQGAQTRTFAYDSLGHVTDSTNPELGHIHYGYDNDGNLISKTSPLANESSGSDTITIQYSYDALHRMLTKSYSGTSGASSVVTAMPTAAYNYDQASVAGKTLENPVGRLTSDSTTLSGTVQAGSVYSYDTAGAIESHFQCVLSACGSGAYNDVEYDRDGAGDLTSLTTPRNGVTATYDDAGHLTSLTPGWTPDVNHPSTLLTSASYTPNGGWSTASFGNGTAETYSYTPGWLTGMQVAGENQTSPATSSSGTISLTGSEQSKQVITTQGVKATGTVTITGTDGTYRVCVPNGHGGQTCTTYSDTGSFTVTVGSFTATVNYTSETDAYLAGQMATALSASGSPVTATSSGSVITVTSLIVGPSGDYSLSASSGSDFSGTVSGGSLSGGVNQSGYTVYDSGTVTATIGQVSAQATFGQTDTTATTASRLASAITSASGGALSASASNGNVYVNSVQTGTATNWSMSASVAHDTTDFTSPSFSATTSGMSGGTNPVDQNGTVYSYNLTRAPDGQIVQAVDSVNGTWNYTYDEFNRLTAAAERSGGTLTSSLTWNYDRYGNRWNQNVMVGSGPSPRVAYSSSNNLATTSVGYDVAGNVRSDGLHSYVYDAENRIVTVDGSIGYIYDAEGRRVGKTDGTVYTVTTSADVLDEVKGTTWKRSEIYVGGKHLATVTASGVVFVHGDWLGTERARTNMAGVVCESMTSLPFGDNATPAGSCNLSPDFLTGKPRDAESGLDDFGARYLSSQWGRWMSADWTAAASAVPYATLTNPQSLNLYAYVGNDPIDGQDRDGHARYDKGASGCAAYGSLCSAGGEYGDQGSLDLEQVRIDGIVAEWNAALQQNASPAAQTNQEATTPASAPPAQQTYGRQADGSYKADPAKVQAAIDAGKPILEPGNPDKSSECVYACKALSQMNGIGTSQWSKGRAALELNDTTDIGLAIATLGSGHYHSDHGNSGIYMGHDKDGGLKIVDQWPGNGPAHDHPNPHTLHTDSPNLSMNAAAYYVIIVKNP